MVFFDFAFTNETTAAKWPRSKPFQPPTTSFYPASTFDYKVTTTNTTTTTTGTEAPDDTTVEEPEDVDVIFDFAQ